MTDVSIETIEHLDFDHAPPCEYWARRHEEFGTGPAVLAAHVAATPCGCRGAVVRLSCDGCWAYFVRTGMTYCTDCYERFPVWPLILSVVRL